MANGFYQAAIVGGSAVTIGGHSSAPVGDGVDAIVRVISPARYDVRVLTLLGYMFRLHASITVVSELGFLTGACRAARIGQVIRRRCPFEIPDHGNLITGVVVGHCSCVKRAASPTRTCAIEIPHFGFNSPS